ncbi:hypothetical protein BWI97_13805 [Siphonobacter sp. BAB-5405]|uniref:PPC domain-containing protein n=1 Tax=Siphonobacter sp. BAB-5405 TaxID=1864825 RepID=UPI000C80BBB7|nr:PPC domain-containing protein [Siphonobacter sp. BAB-5405]PMD95673.1 hypothetical protein BWI97_13805 [Siphonobacter sp. BAB-5405]
MRKSFLLVVLSLLAFTSFAQQVKKRKPARKKGTVTVKAPAASQTALDAHRLQAGQAFAYDVVKGTLSKTDAADAEKRYADSYTLTLNAGEEVRLEVASDWYRVSFSLETPDKQVTTQTDHEEFPGFSIQKLKYTVPASGTYTLRISSTDPNQTGDYLIRKYLLPAESVLPAETASFCDRIHFLLAQHQDHFSRIKGKKTRTDKKAGITEHYQTAFAFLPGKPSEILLETEQEKMKYQTILAEFPTKEQALQVHKEYIQQVKTCLDGWQSDEFSGEKFQEFSMSSYTDFLTVMLKEAGKKKYQVVLGLD